MSQRGCIHSRLLAPSDSCLFRPVVAPLLQPLCFGGKVLRTFNAERDNLMALKAGNRAGQIGKLPQGRHSDGNGLALQVKATGSRSWTFAYRRPATGKPTTMGLGAARYGDRDPSAGLTLDEARAKVAEFRAMLRDGTDPKDPMPDSPEGPTLGMAWDAYVAERAPAWKARSRTRDAWDAAMRLYVAPIASNSVAEIDARAVNAVVDHRNLRDKPRQRRDVAQRIGSVLEYATAKGWRTATNPVRGIIRQMPKPKVKHAEHIEDVAKVADAVARFDEATCSPVYPLALRFQILTGARMVEVRYATWAEIDLDAATWTIEGEGMKSGQRHRVPLSPQALDVLQAAKDHPKLARVGSARIFPALGGADTFDDSAIRKAMKRAGIPATPHGWRSTMRRWMMREPGIGWAAGEMCLAHTSAFSDVERSYMGGEDLIDERREIMRRYADALALPEAA